MPHVTWSMSCRSKSSVDKRAIDSRHLEFTRRLPSISAISCKTFSILPRSNTELDDTLYLPFTRENRKFQLENQMVRAILFGKLQKIWAVIWGDAIFLLFKVSLPDVDIFYSDSLSRNLAFNCFTFMPEISNRMVFVNGKHPIGYSISEQYLLSREWQTKMVSWISTVTEKEIWPPMLSRLTQSIYKNGFIPSYWETDFFTIVLVSLKVKQDLFSFLHYKL